MLKLDERTGVYHFEPDRPDYTNLRELTPIHDGRKSFYRKAYTADYPAPDGGTMTVLWSYWTPVAAYDRDGFHRLWDGYSATTSRHVHEFRLQHGDVAIGKAEWERLPVETMGMTYERRPRECKPFTIEFF